MIEENKEVLDFLKPGAEQTEVTEEIPPEAMMEVNLFDMVALLVKQLGITHVYGLQAGGMWPYECTMMKAGIARIAVRHEQTATFAAEAEARILGRPGMALIGPGTGITNASTGVVQAYAAQSPMFVLVGEQDGGSALWKSAQQSWAQGGVPLTVHYVPDKGHQWLFGKAQVTELEKWLEQVAAGKLPSQPASAPASSPATRPTTRPQNPIWY